MMSDVEPTHMPGDDEHPEVEPELLPDVPVGGAPLPEDGSE